MSAFWLRFIALATMLIDHIGAILLPQFTFLRIIGRISFPIYAFLIVNGYRHTRNRWQYLLRLILFALISEVPHDVAFYMHGQGVIEFSNQNIFFTLGLGLLAMMARDWLEQRGVVRSQANFMVFVPASIVAELLGFSYGAVGILTLFLFDLRWDKVIPTWTAGVALTLVFYAMTPIQAYGALAMIPISMYNGKPGLRNPLLQYGFYLFYPVHLLALYAVHSML